MEHKMETQGCFSELDMEILLLIQADYNSNKKLHERLRQRKGKKVPKSTISRHTTRLRESSLIKQSKEFNRRPFELTDKGIQTISIFLAGGAVGVLEYPIRGHAFGFISQIVRYPQMLEKKLKQARWIEFHPKNRVAYKKRVLGCMVVFNPRSVQFMPSEVYGPNQYACFDEAFRLVLRVKEWVETEYAGLVIGQPEEVSLISRQHYARLCDPLAMEYYKTSVKDGMTLTYQSDRLHIDFSKGLPELETVHRVHAKDDLRKITDFYEFLVRHDFNFDDYLVDQDMKYDGLTQDITSIRMDLGTVGETLRDFSENIHSHLHVLQGIGTNVNNLAEVVENLENVVRIIILPLLLLEKILNKGREAVKEIKKALNTLLQRLHY